MCVCAKCKCEWAAWGSFYQLGTDWCSTRSPGAVFKTACGCGYASKECMACSGHAGYLYGQLPTGQYATPVTGHSDPTVIAAVIVHLPSSLGSHNLDQPLRIPEVAQCLDISPCALSMSGVASTGCGCCASRVCYQLSCVASWCHTRGATKAAAEQVHRPTVGSRALP